MSGQNAVNIKDETVLSSLLHVHSPHFTVTCFSTTCATGIAIRSPEMSYLLGSSTAVLALVASFLWNLSSLLRCLHHTPRLLQLISPTFPLLDLLWGFFLSMTLTLHTQGFNVRFLFLFIQHIISGNHYYPHDFHYSVYAIRQGCPYLYNINISPAFQTQKSS